MRLDTPTFVEGDVPEEMHQLMAGTMRKGYRRYSPDQNQCKEEK